MHFVNRHRLAQQIALSARLHPSLIAPGMVAESPNDRRRTRRSFREEGVGIRLLLHLTGARQYTIFVMFPSSQRGHEKFPHAAVAMHHRMAGTVPAVEFADDCDL